MRLMHVWALLAAGTLGCATTPKQSSVELRFAELQDNALPRERTKETQTLSVALIGGAQLKFKTPAELLKAAEPPEGGGGSPKLLMRAGRSFIPGTGLVFYGTARSTEATSTGGSVAQLVIYELALGCEPTDPEAPGDLKACTGYLLRVPNQWPGEVYEITEVTASIIPLGGTTSGRIRARSKQSGFAVELEGEFTASVLEFASP